MSKADDKLDLLYRQEFSHLTRDEFAYFVEFCREKGVNPWLRHIIPQRVYDERRGATRLQFITTIMALRTIALSTRRYEGLKGPSWCGKDGAWVDVWLHPEPPEAATVGVYRKGFREPLFQTATFPSFAQFEQTRDGKSVPTPFWVRMGAHMLAKCAEALSLRAAFPEKCGELLIPEEVMQTGGPGGQGRPPAAGPGEAAPTTAPDQFDLNRPQSRFQFELALIDLGLQNPERRAAVIAEFQRGWSRLYHEQPVQFYAQVLQEVRKRPGVYGAAAT